MLASNLELLRHIKLETAFILTNITKVTSYDIALNPVMSRAIVRSLEIIGEATKKISEEVKIAYPFVEWKKMAGLRDKLIHDYFGIDYEIVTDIVVNKIPLLDDFIEQIINDIQINIQKEDTK